MPTNKASQLHGKMCFKSIVTGLNIPKLIKRKKYMLCVKTLKKKQKVNAMAQW